jgi:hypothetical protein
MKNSAKVWTPEEIELVATLYPTATQPILEQALPNRTYEAIKSRAKLLGLWRPSKVAFSAEEDALIKSNFPTQPTFELAKLLGRPVKAIATRAHALQVRKDKDVVTGTRRRNRVTPEPDKRFARTGTPTTPGQKALKHPKQERFSLSSYLKPLSHNHPDMQAWLRATKPGSPAGSAPRTLSELRAYEPSLFYCINESHDCYRRFAGPTGCHDYLQNH